MAKGIEDFPEGWECDQSLSDEIIKCLQLELKDNDDEAYASDIATDGTSADEKKTASLNSTPFNFKDIANSSKPKINPEVLQGPVENLLKQGYTLINGNGSLQ
ncbi:hypothetical protein BS47DRAFT_1368906 [Hydnum rufescens UP504]|uniref:Uncharacterized protein n=1 Tax=Hydnum rufescens UP504 TaxID=1448309 RepID=A0A9P6DMH8_9AGAM|nr:hypothetical protein BS47DRAFT_1368906 [Hydnum rufescens UP504]